MGHNVILPSEVLANILTEYYSSDAAEAVCHFMKENEAENWTLLDIVTTFSEVPSEWVTDENRTLILLNNDMTLVQN